jgi:hypothetical protein
MKTKKNLVVVLLFLFSICTIQAQELGDFKPKDNTFGIGKLKGKQKKIYISNFNVNYQLYNEKQKTQKGGSLFRDKGVKGDATAELSVGLASLSEADFQTTTDALYQDFVAMLKKEGFEIISPDKAASIESYKGWTKASGPFIRESMPGMLQSVPSGYSFFYEEKSAVGSFLSEKFQGGMNLPQKISKELDDAVVADVDLYVFFMKDTYAFQGGAANIKIKTALSLVANEVVAAKSDDKSLLFRKQVEYVTGASQINFVCGKYNIGGGAESVYTGGLKNDLSIGGVIEEKKIQSFAKGNVDFIGTSTYYGKLYSASNKKVSQTNVIPVDVEKYKTGVRQAGDKFLQFHVDAFASNFK